MIDVALAQGAPGAGPSALVQIIPFALVFAVFYFLLIRPQQQKAREHQTMLANLKKNDQVITAGGLFGKVIEIKEQKVLLEVAPNVRVHVHRPQINTVLSAPAADGSGKAK